MRINSVVVDPDSQGAETFARIRIYCLDLDQDVPIGPGYGSRLEMLTVPKIAASVKKISFNEHQ